MINTEGKLTKLSMQNINITTVWPDKQYMYCVKFICPPSFVVETDWYWSSAMYYLPVISPPWSLTNLAWGWLHLGIKPSTNVSYFLQLVLIPRLRQTNFRVDRQILFFYSTSWFKSNFLRLLLHSFLLLLPSDKLLLYLFMAPRPLHQRPNRCLSEFIICGYFWICIDNPGSEPTWSLTWSEYTLHVIIFEFVVDIPILVRVRKCTKSLTLPVINISEYIFNARLCLCHAYIFALPARRIDAWRHDVAKSVPKNPSNPVHNHQKQR